MLNNVSHLRCLLAKKEYSSTLKGTYIFFMDACWSAECWYSFIEMLDSTLCRFSSWLPVVFPWNSKFEIEKTFIQWRRANKGLTLETLAIQHQTPQAKNIPYQPLLLKPIFSLLTNAIFFKTSLPVFHPILFNNLAGELLSHGFTSSFFFDIHHKIVQLEFHIFTFLFYLESFLEILWRFFKHIFLHSVVASSHLFLRRSTLFLNSTSTTWQTFVCNMFVHRLQLCSTIFTTFGKVNSSSRSAILWFVFSGNVAEHSQTKKHKLL